MNLGIKLCLASSALLLTACPPSNQSATSATPISGASANQLCSSNQACAQGCQQKFASNPTSYQNCLNSYIGSIKPTLDGKLEATGDLIPSCDGQGQCTYIEVNPQ